MKTILAKSLPVLALTGCLLCNVSASAQENTAGATASNSSQDKAHPSVDENKVVGARTTPKAAVGSTWNTGASSCFNSQGCVSYGNICENTG